MNVIGRLSTAIGYPQVVPADTVEFVFKVDDSEMRAMDLGKRLVLLREITRKEEELPRLASYASGRVLRDNAILFWDERVGAAVLSQEIASSASPLELKVFFETFADSCDWWSARVEAEPVNSSTFPEMVIRP